MALYNLSANNYGSWVAINPVSNDDGFGNLIVNTGYMISIALKFINSDKEIGDSHGSN